MQNIIIGKNSSLTKRNVKFLKNFTVLSVNELNQKNIEMKITQNKRINLILNNFFPSKFLNDLSHSNYRQFCNLSLERLIFLLERIPTKKINKIIYTSSSAVHRLSNNISDEKQDKFNRQLYSSFKLAAEKLIINYANSNNKDYFIMRLFNTYGDKDDEFSFIEKIIRAKKNDDHITLINKGISLRDFVHLDDVAKIYNLFLIKKIKKGIYDIGTGKGVLIKDLIQITKIKSKKIKRVNKIEEIQNSIADTKKLLSQLPNFKFKELTQYLQKELNLTNNLNFKSLSYLKKNNLDIPGVAIYGAGNAGKQIFNELSKNKENIICFIDDNSQLQNSILNGVPIISYDDIFKLNIYTKIKRIFLAIPSLDKISQTKKLIKIKKDFFDVRFLPEKKFLLSDQINLNDLNIDEINDILNRKQFKIKKIKKLKNKKVLVTGAAGTIGSEICRQLIQQKVNKVIAVDKSEIGIYNLQNKNNSKKIYYKLIDINNIKFLEKVIKKESIDIIFHAAAYKHVNILEKNIFSAVKNNVIATYNLCKLSHRYSCDMIFISTDKAANPKSVLGYTKRVAEKICEYFNHLKNKDSFINIVRFGNVFGSSGSAITNFLEQINLDKPIKITHPKASRYFMTITEACHLVIQTTEINSKNKIFVLNMGKPLNILNLAKSLGMIRTKINSNYTFRYQVIGLKSGEKLNETIVDNKEIKTKFNNEIFFVRSKVNKISSFVKFYQKLTFIFEKQNEKELFKQLVKIKNL